MTPDEIMRQCEACRDKHAACFADVEHRLTILEVTLWGQGGGNGIKAVITNVASTGNISVKTTAAGTISGGANNGPIESR